MKSVSDIEKFLLSHLICEGEVMRDILLNYRKGFACNSSSTHSVIADDGLITDEFSEFGWSRFHVGAKDVNVYIAAALGDEFSRDEEWKFDTSRPRYDKQSMKEVLGLEEWPIDAHVDHQSCPQFSKDPATGLIDVEFVRDLYGWFRENNYGVVGGNDNDGEMGSLPEAVLEPYRTDGSNLAGRKSGDIWTMIDDRDGCRVRISFKENPAAATSPELVDLKITDYCTFGCKYCYQGSTTLGVHATLESIKLILDDLAEGKVLEVAIGGGEPTQHPQFREIVAYARSKGIIPNVTTRNVWFLLEFVAEKWPEIGGVAFSIDTEVGANHVAGAVMLATYEMTNRITAQIVDKSVQYKTNLNRILGILDEHKIRVTWLGYKTTGFGTKYIEGWWNKPDWNFVMDVLCRYEFMHRISVDTAMLSDYKEALRTKYSGYNRTATEEEGVTSCYIDAVKRVIGASSYHEETFEPYVSLGSQFMSIRKALT